MKKLNNNSGFTIIELMIATSIFSVILLVGTALVVQIGRMYYKGVSLSRTQETTRNVVEDISRSVQFSSSFSGMNPNANTISIGDICYSFNINVPVISGSDNVALQKKNTSDCSVAFDDGEELLGENMRLAKINVSSIGSGNLATIDVGVIYASGGSDNGADLYNEQTALIGPYPYVCKGSYTGSQWCATSYLSTTVFRRAN